MEKDKILLIDTPFASLGSRSLIGIALTGAVAGTLTLILTLATDKVVLQPAMCTGSAVASCAQSTQLAFHIASIVAAIVATVMLAQSSVYRPLFAAIAVTTGLWNTFASFVDKAAWPAQLLVLVSLNIIGYFAFTWILRTYNLTIALVASAALVVAMLLVTSL